MRNSQKVIEIFTNRGYDVSIRDGVLTIHVEELGVSHPVKYLDEHGNIDYLITRIQGDLKRMTQETHLDIFKIKFLKQLLSRKIETWVNHYLRTGNERIMFAVPEKDMRLVFNILYEIIKQYVTIDIDITHMEETEMGCDVSIHITNK